MSGQGTISLLDVYAARRRLLPYLSTTPLRLSEWLSERTRAHVRLKVESLNLTNSFKIRGAFNAALRLIERGQRPMLVTASAGNHGRALALAAQRLGLHATVFTPATAPATKKSAIRQSGATLHDEAADYDTAERLARAYARDHDATYLSPYNHPDVIAGAGTIGLEVLEAFPDLEVIVVPIGGGGLVSGVALALKAAAPHVSVVGVEVEASMPFATGFARGTITEIDVKPSLADGLVGNLEPGSTTFELVRRHVDRLASVSESALRDAMRGIIEEEHLIAEGAGAVATAAVLAGGVVSPGQRAVVLVTGANVDLPLLIAQIRE
jgi:threonine dehydratase